MTTSSSAFGPPANESGAPRKKTERRLNELTAPNGLITPSSPSATVKIYKPYDRARRKFRQEIIDSYMSDSADVGKDGLAAIVTAGPPGAGKSTKIEHLDESISGYRRLDADKIKDVLLDRAVTDGIFDSFLKQILPDARPILPNELAALVHTESADLHNELIRMSLEDNVNVIIEGTLSWPELVNRYYKWFAAADYTSLKILDVEVDCHTALEHASKRWWDGREEYFAGTGSPRGGRFTPAAAISHVYPRGVSTSICNINSVDFFNDRRASIFEELELIVHDGSSDEPKTYISRDGIVEGSRPEPLILPILRGLDDDPGIVVVGA